MQTNLDGPSNISHSFNNLSNLSKTKLLPESNKDLGNRIKTAFSNFISKIISPRRDLDTYRTQEHLLFGKARAPGDHYATFSKALKNSDISNDEIQYLRKQINELDSQYGLVSKPHNVRRRLNPFGESQWVNSTHDALKKLTPGESKLVEIVSQDHAMMMRIEKKENGSFTLYFTNTGLGILENPDFHPVKVNEDGTQTYRLMSQIDNISESQLLEGPFLKNLIQAIDSNKDQIKQIYDVLRSLPPANTNDDPRHWNRQQTVGSCSASCISVTIRSVLKPEDFAKVETHMQVQALVRSYQLLKSNSDRSKTRKIMILDLVQSLKQNPLIKHEEKEILLDIEKEVKELLKIKNPEMLVSQSSRVSINHFISKKDETHAELSPFSPVLSNSKNSSNLENRINKTQTNTKLKAYLTMDTNFASQINTKYQLEKNENDRWVGVDVDDKMALVSFYIANGDQEQIEFYMIDLLNELKNNPNRAINDKKFDTQQCLNILAFQLNQLDQTRSGIAKTLFLSGLVLQQICLRNEIDLQELQKDLWEIDRFDQQMNSKFDTIIKKWKEEIKNDQDKSLLHSAITNFTRAKYLFANLNVNSHLDSDNIWMKGLNVINIRQPQAAPSAPLTHEPQKPMDFNIKTQLDQPNPDVTASQIGQKILS